MTVAMVAADLFEIDPQITQFEKSVYDTPLIKDVWRKYFYKGETHPEQAYMRVASAIANSKAEAKEAAPYTAGVFYELMRKRLFLPWVEALVQTFRLFVLLMLILVASALHRLVQSHLWIRSMQTVKRFVAQASVEPRRWVLLVILILICLLLSLPKVKG